MHEIPPILMILVLAVAAPWLSERTGSLRVPSVVFEISLGVLVGPHVLGWVHADHGIPYVATMGMAFLFFLAGMEIDLGSLRGEPIKLASLSWLVSLALGFAAAGALAVTLDLRGWPLVAVALSTTALGIVVPVLRDVELTGTPLGKFTLASGTMAEIGPIILMSVLLSQEHGVGVQLALVLVFILVVVGVFWASLRVRPPGLLGLLARTMTRSGQLPMRVSLLLLTALVVLAEELGLDLALGAFAAGMAVGLAVRDNHDPVLHHKFDAVGFGFLIPVFFVASGIRLDVSSLASSPMALGMMFVYALLLIVTRGLPVVVFRRVLPANERRALGFYSATSLSLIVVITSTAVQRGLMAAETGAALVGGGLLSVLLFPVLGTRIAGGQRVAAAGPPPGNEY